jgi:hypothetical protein
MAADWGVVRDMLTGDKPRRDAQGRDVFEVWADMVLANPPQEYARVARDILSPETPENSNTNAMVTNIQSLYLTALQAANRVPDPRIVDAIAKENDPGVPDARDGATEW